MVRGPIVVNATSDLSLTLLVTHRITFVMLLKYWKRAA